MSRIFRSIVFVAFSGVLLSSACKEQCGFSKDKIDAIGTNFELATIEDHKGEDGCGFLIAIDRGDQKQLFIPVEMDAEFEIDGLSVKIKFHTSRIKQDGCFDAQPIVIDAIEKI